jgi:hypothetical protein
LAKTATRDVASTIQKYKIDVGRRIRLGLGGDYCLSDEKGGCVGTFSIFDERQACGWDSLPEIRNQICAEIK